MFTFLRLVFLQGLRYSGTLSVLLESPELAQQPMVPTPSHWALQPRLYVAQEHIQPVHLPAVLLVPWARTHRPRDSQAAQLVEPANTETKRATPVRHSATNVLQALIHPCRSPSPSPTVHCVRLAPILQPRAPLTALYVRLVVEALIPALQV